jgi:hypothetical protein
MVGPTGEAVVLERRGGGEGGRTGMGGRPWGGRERRRG